MEEEMALPPRYYNRPNSLPRFLWSLTALFIMLGALPIGVYLVGQRTSILPQAAPENVERSGTVSYLLEKDLLAGRQDNQYATTSAQVAVDLLVHSDDTEANLFAARIDFPTQYLELVNVATSSAEFQSAGTQALKSKWIESKVDNQLGRVDLIAGVANPGVKTEIDQKYVLAKLIFNVKSSGLATFHLDPDSTIFGNLSSQPLDTRKNDLTFELPQVNIPPVSPVPTPNPRFIPFRRQSASLLLTSPIGGETIGFNTPAQITWDVSNLNRQSFFAGQVLINLLINGEKLGQIAAVSADLGSLDWKPIDFILPTFLIPSNTYQIEITGTTVNGEVLSDISRGPFAVVTQDINLEASQAANLAKRGGDGNKDGKVDLIDLSILLSSFGKKDNLDLGVDLNGDGAVNDVDLWLFKGILIK